MATRLSDTAIDDRLGADTDEYGCRHSDTIAIAESGTETLPHFSLNIDSNAV